MALVALLVALECTASAAPHGALRPLHGKAGCIVSRHYSGAPKSCARGRALGDMRGLTLDPSGQGIYTASFEDGISHVVRGRGGALSVQPGRGGCVVEQDPEFRDGCTEVPSLDDPEGIAVTPNGADLYVGAGNSSGVFGFARAPSGGLTPLAPPGGCSAKPDPGPTSSCTPFPALAESAGLVISPDGQFVYVAAHDAVVGLARDEATGNISPLPPLTGCVQEAPAPDGCSPGRGLKGPDSLALTADGRFLYAESDNGVAVLARDPTTGTLTQAGGPEGCVHRSGAEGCTQARTDSSSFGTNGVVLSPDDRNLYEAFDAGVATFARDPATGALTQLPGTKGCANHHGKLGCAPSRGGFQSMSLAASPDGRSIYVSGSNGGGALLAFARSPADGALTQLPRRSGCYLERLSVARKEGCTQAPLTAEMGVAVSQNGRVLYGLSDRGGVSAFARTP
jgi:DNA-binding beta-propeller fold protein YncE